jgi:hypothetical protein
VVIPRVIGRTLVISCAVGILSQFSEGASKKCSTLFLNHFQNIWPNNLRELETYFGSDLWTRFKDNVKDLCISFNKWSCPNSFTQWFRWHIWQLSWSFLSERKWNWQKESRSNSRRINCGVSQAPLRSRDDQSRAFQLNFVYLKGSVHELKLIWSKVISPIRLLYSVICAQLDSFAALSRHGTIIVPGSLRFPFWITDFEKMRFCHTSFIFEPLFLIRTAASSSKNIVSPRISQVQNFDEYHISLWVSITEEAEQIMKFKFVSRNFILISINEDLFWHQKTIGQSLLHPQMYGSTEKLREIDTNLSRTKYLCHLFCCQNFTLRFVWRGARSTPAAPHPPAPTNGSVSGKALPPYIPGCAFSKTPKQPPSLEVFPQFKLIPRPPKQPPPPPSLLATGSSQSHAPNISCFLCKTKSFFVKKFSRSF